MPRGWVGCALAVGMVIVTAAGPRGDSSIRPAVGAPVVGAAKPVPETIAKADTERDLRPLLEEAHREIGLFVKRDGDVQDRRALYRAWGNRLLDVGDAAQNANTARLQQLGAGFAFLVHGYDTDRVLTVMAAMSADDRRVVGDALDREATVLSTIVGDNQPVIYWRLREPEWAEVNRLLADAVADVFAATRPSLTVHTAPTSQDLAGGDPVDAREARAAYRAWARRLAQYAATHAGTEKVRTASSAAFAYRILAGDLSDVDGDRALEELPDPAGFSQAVILNLMANAKITGDQAPILHWAEHQLMRATNLDARASMQMLLGRVHEQSFDLARARPAFEATRDTAASSRLSEAARTAMKRLDTKNINLAPTSAAPAFAGTTLGGNVVSLTSLRGKVTLLNIAATYCPMCRAELPELEAIYRRDAAKGLEIITAWLDGDEQKVIGMVAKYHLDWPQIVVGTGPNREVLSNYIVFGTPTNYLIDRDGTIIHSNIPMNQLADGIAVALKR